MEKDKNLDEMKREAIKVIIRSEWDEENTSLGEKKETVYMKKEPTAIAMRIFKEDEDYETQVMRECDAFLEKYGVYPNGIVMNPITFDRWYGVAQDSALETEVDDYLENMTFSEIKRAARENQECICEFKPSENHKGTLFAMPKFLAFIIENKEYQNGVYQLLNGYSPSLENGKTIEIHLDFMQGSNKDFTMTSTLLKEAGVSFTKNDSETLLSDELTEKLVKRFAVVHMACAYPHDSFSYNPD